MSDDPQHPFDAATQTTQPGRFLPADDSPAPRSFGDYEILGEIARGGMGVVYRARQVSLNRPVALKMILAGQLAGAAEVQRFRAEAEAAANLEHPNILPVYDVGEHDGQHYFSMKLVEGGSLAEAIRARRLGARDGAALLARVARAVHFAHQHGVLHRDLKPANVVLDRDGVPYVTDFGLAKRVEGDLTLTKSGAILGTPGYMSPEQARSGKQLTTASDVYSLGATLYELLTGRPPFHASTQLDTILQLLEREPDDPRRLNPAADRDLTTVALKCLNKDPAKRYASAEALADDLERWLRGEPITARPTGSLERAWRWCRRNPALAAALAALAVAIIGGGAVATTFGLRARQKAKLAIEALDAREHALAEVTRERDRANRRERETRQAIREYFTEVSNNPELRAAGLEPLRKKLLAKPLAYYRRFIEERNTDPELKADLAEAHLQLAMIVAETDDRNRAVAELEEALRLYRELHKDNPSDPAVHRNLADTLRQLGVNSREVGRLPQAKAATLESIEHLREMRADQSDDPELADLLAGAYTALGAVYGEEGATDAERDSHAKALAVRRAILKGRPADFRAQYGVAQSLYNLGSGCVMAQRWKQAEEAYVEALRYWRPLHKSDPAETSTHHLFGSTLCNLGLVYSATDRSDKAMASWVEARDVLGRLVRAHPTVTEFQHDLATTQMNLAIDFEEAGRHKEAEEAQAQALAISQKLVDDNPSVTEFAIELGGVLCNTGNWFGKRKQPGEALPYFDRAVAALRRVLAQAPGQPRAKEFLAKSYLGRANALMDLKRLRDALGDWNELKKLAGAYWSAEFRQKRLTCLAEVDRDAALKEVDELSGRSLGATNLYQLSTTAARLAGDDDKRAAKAVELLRRAVGKGFADVERLKKDENFAPLRKREDFQRVIRDVEAKAKPGVWLS
jgi:tetratricopeptide (TPR) repeat protein